MTLNTETAQKTLGELISASDMKVNLYFKKGNRRETHKLRYAIIKNNFFWAKTGNVYAPNLFGSTVTAAVKSRIFSNFCNMDCIADINTRSFQLLSSRYYDDKDFVATKPFKKLWEYGEKITPELFVNAVEMAKSMKCVIQDENDFIIVTPIHTIEAHTKENTFRFDTDYDGYPPVLQDFDSCLNYAKEFDKIFDENNGTLVPQSNFIKECEFFLSYFEVTPDKVLQKTVSENGSIGVKRLPFKSLKIYVED